MMDDSEFLRLLDEKLDPPAGPNPKMAETEIVWERDNPGFGARHILEHHGVTEQEVEQVLFEVPPHVEARRHPEFPN